jgi:hypothetical protein
MTNAEAELVCDAIAQVAANWQEWCDEYTYDAPANEYKHNYFKGDEEHVVHDWFTRTLAE